MYKIISFFLSVIMFIVSPILVSSGREVNEYLDVSCGTQSQRQSFDLYLPAKTEDEIGLVVYIHGGAWAGGDKAGAREFCEKVTLYHGYASATLNYRMIDEGADYTEMLDDIHASLAEIKNIAETNGYKISSCMLTGTSAGGHLALLYSYKCDDVSPIPISFCVDMCGPTDLTNEEFYDVEKCHYIEALIGCVAGVADIEGLTTSNWQDYKEELRLVSPMTYLDPDDVPTLIFHGTEDTTVPFSNATELDTMLDNMDIEHELVAFRGADHGFNSGKAPFANLKAQKLFFDWCEKYFGY